jgi:transposase
MPQREIDSLSSNGAQLVASLLARIDGLMAQIAARDDRIDELLAQVKALNACIAVLEAKRGGPPKTPDNSSLPPSRGQKANAEPPAVKRRRKGRPGVARKLAENPDATRRFFAEHCACGAVLSEAGQELAKEYDHIDIPPIRPITTRVELFRATCPCCKARVTASAPADMPEGTPFGPGIASTIAYLHGCQMIGFKRLTEVCQGLFGLTISQGAIANVLARVGEAITAPAERIAAEVRASEVIASDETSARVKGKTWWQWTFGCATAVYHVIAPTRGKCVPTDFLAGARPKVWLSDRLPAQCTHAEAHQFCLAHLIRDAQYAIDHGDTIFAPQFKAFLKDACAVGRRRPDLVDSTIATHRRRLDRELDRLLNLKPTDVEGSHLRATIAVTARDKLLVFLTRRDVEATNNESERALRPSVIFRRVTNGFRSEWGAKVYADLCSVVATGRLAGRTALAVIGDALAAPAPELTAARSGG